MLRSLTLGTFITNAGTMGLGLIASVLLARGLGPTVRGEVQAAMLWPVLLGYLSSMGLITSTLYFTALPESKVKIIFTNVMAFTAIQSLIALPIGFVALPWLLASQTSTVVYTARLFLLVIPIFLATQYCMTILQGRMHISLFNWLRFIIPLGYVIGAVVLLASGKLTLLSIIILHLILHTITFIGTLIALLKSGIHLGFQVDIALAKQMLKYGFKVQIGDIPQAVNLRFDQVLVAAWLPPSQLGFYTVAINCASLSQVLSTAVRMVVTPSIAQKASPSERAILLQRVFRRYWLLSILATIAIGIILPAAIPIVFGVNFQNSIWPSEVLLFGSLFLGAKDVLTGGSQALGNPWLSSRAELAGFVVTVVLLLTLLPRMGIMGAAIASVAAYATLLGIVVHGLYRTYAIQPKGLFRADLRDLKYLLAPVKDGNWAKLARSYRN